MTPEQQQPQNPLNESVERDVRMLIGDLHIQIIMLRNLLTQAQQQQQQPTVVKPNGGVRPDARV